MKKWIVSSLALALCSTMALADATDREKPISVEASSFKADQVNQVATYTGNVVVRQGTLQMNGNKLVITENAKGYRQMELFGKNATFRQRRDPQAKGIEEWFEAEAQRIVYDSHRSRTIIQGSAGGRASTVIAPRNKANATPDTPATKLNSSTKISTP